MHSVVPQLSTLITTIIFFTLQPCHCTGATPAPTWPGDIVCGTNGFCVGWYQGNVYCYGRTDQCMWDSNDCSSATDCEKYTTDSAGYTNGDYPDCPASGWRTDAPCPWPRANTTIQVNFQDTATNALNGWLKDDGSTFAERPNGYSYGWECGHDTTTGRNRNQGGWDALDNTNIVPDQLGTCSGERWNFNLASGRYVVDVVFLDTEYPANTAGCTLEGAAIDLGSSNAGTAIEFQRTVDITDGTLTFAGSWSETGCGGLNRLVISEETTPAPTAPTPAPTASTEACTKTSCPGYAKIGTSAVCIGGTELERTGAGWGDIEACKGMCETDSSCDAFVWWDDRGCRTYTACDTTEAHSGSNHVFRKECTTASCRGYVNKGTYALCAGGTQLSITAPDWGNIEACRDTCESESTCNGFVWWDDRGCRTYTACDSTVSDGGSNHAFRKASTASYGTASRGRCVDAGGTEVKHIHKSTSPVSNCVDECSTKSTCDAYAFYPQTATCNLYGYAVDVTAGWTEGAATSSNRPVGGAASSQPVSEDDWSCYVKQIPTPAPTLAPSAPTPAPSSPTPSPTVVLEGRYRILAEAPNGNRGPLAVWGLQDGDDNGLYVRWHNGDYTSCAYPECDFFISSLGNGKYKIEAEAPNGNRGPLAVWDLQIGDDNGLYVRWYNVSYTSCSYPGCDFYITSLGAGKYKIEAEALNGNRGPLEVWGLQDGDDDGRYIRWYNGAYSSCLSPGCDFYIEQATMAAPTPAPTALQFWQNESSWYDIDGDTVTRTSAASMFWRTIAVGPWVDAGTVSAEFRYDGGGGACNQAPGCSVAFGIVADGYDLSQASCGHSSVSGFNCQSGKGAELLGNQWGMGGWQTCSSSGIQITDTVQLEVDMVAKVMIAYINGNQCVEFEDIPQRVRVAVATERHGERVQLLKFEHVAPTAPTPGPTAPTPAPTSPTPGPTAPTPAPTLAPSSPTPAPIAPALGCPDGHPPWNASEHVNGCYIEQGECGKSPGPNIGSGSATSIAEVHNLCLSETRCEAIIYRAEQQYYAVLGRTYNGNYVTAGDDVMIANKICTTTAPTAPTPGPTAPTPAPTSPTPGPTAPTPAPTSPTPGPTAPTPAPTLAPSSPTPAPTAPVCSASMTAIMVSNVSALCVPQQGGRVQYFGEHCGQGRIYWTSATTLDVRPGLASNQCTWDWTNHPAPDLYGGSCGVAPTVNGGEQLPMACEVAREDQAPPTPTVATMAPPTPAPPTAQPPTEIPTAVPTEGPTSPPTALPTAPPTTPLCGYTCASSDSQDCISEYGNAVQNKNLEGFYERCRTEGGADALRNSCSKCCESCLQPTLPPTVEPTTIIRAGNLHLAPVGAKVCDSGQPATESMCEAAVAQLAAAAGEQPGRSLQIGTGGTCGDRAWGEVPLGCSAQSGGDWAAHYKSTGVNCPHAHYQLVCYDVTSLPTVEPTTPMPPTYAPPTPEPPTEAPTLQRLCYCVSSREGGVCDGSGMPLAVYVDVPWHSAAGVLAAGRAAIAYFKSELQPAKAPALEITFFSVSCDEGRCDGGDPWRLARMIESCVLGGAKLVVGWHSKSGAAMRGQFINGIAPVPHLSVPHDGLELPASEISDAVEFSMVPSRLDGLRGLVRVLKFDLNVSAATVWHCSDEEGWRRKDAVEQEALELGLEVSPIEVPVGEDIGVPPANGTTRRSNLDSLASLAQEMGSTRHIDAMGHCGRWDVRSFLTLQNVSFVGFSTWFSSSEPGSVVGDYYKTWLPYYKYLDSPYKDVLPLDGEVFVHADIASSIESGIQAMWPSAQEQQDALADLVDRVGEIPRFEDLSMEERYFFDALVVGQLALSRAGVKSTLEMVSAQLANIDVEGLTGRIAFDARSRRQHNLKVSQYELPDGRLSCDTGHLIVRRQ